MAAQFHDEASGRPVALKPEAPPQLDFAWDRPRNPRMLASVRAEAVVASLREALAHLGYRVVDEPGARSVDLFWGAAAPERPARCWLKPGPTEDVVAQELLDRGFSLDELRLCCLSRHYRKPLSVSRDDLARAKDELARLRDAALRLAVFAPAANPAGLAGYKKRFRDALARDLDLPEALACLWDALRPGALSPGSQLGMLREADPVFGLGFLEKARK